MPLYEYVCRACGRRFEQMRSVAERMRAPACAACGAQATSLAMSVPGRVGAASASASAPVDGCAAGPACCGGVCSSGH